VANVTIGSSASPGFRDVFVTTASEVAAILNAFQVLTNRPPDITLARPSAALLWPNDGKMRDVLILGVTDPDGDPVTIRIDRIMQDEPTNGVGDGNTCPDGAGVGTSTAQVRAERSGDGNGRVYTLFFTAKDGRGGSAQGSVKVSVPHDQGQGNAVDDGPRSTRQCVLFGSSILLPALVGQQTCLYARNAIYHQVRAGAGIQLRGERLRVGTIIAECTRSALQVTEKDNATNLRGSVQYAARP